MIFGHSTAAPGDDKKEKMVGSGINFSDGKLWGTSLIPKNPNGQIYIEKIKASEVMIATCNNGTVNSEFAKKMNGELITLENGTDGKASIIGMANAAYAATETN